MKFILFKLRDGSITAGIIRVTWTDRDGNTVYCVRDQDNKVRRVVPADVVTERQTDVLENLIDLVRESFTKSEGRNV